MKPEPVIVHCRLCQRVLKSAKSIEAGVGSSCRRKENAGKRKRGEKIMRVKQKYAWEQIELDF